LRFPPAGSGFYPRCPVFFWLHLYCPGCGGTRALAALLHGRLNEAMHWNAMVVIFFPFAAVFLALTYWRAMRATTFLWPTIPDSLLKAIPCARRHLHRGQKPCATIERGILE
jgi:hypothetical protein